MLIRPSQPTQGFQRAVRPGLSFLMAFVVSLSLYVRYRDERTHRAEFDIVNSSGMPISARYKGFYGDGDMELATGQHWHRQFRSGARETLYLAGHLEGQDIHKEVPLMDSVADLYSPGRPAQGEILLMHVSTNTEGKAIMYTRVVSNSVPSAGQKTVPEFVVDWRLMRP